MRKSLKFAAEVVERAVRIVFDAKDQYPSQWAAIESIAGKDRLHGRDAAALGSSASGTAARAKRPRRASSGASRNSNASARASPCQRDPEACERVFAQAALDRRLKS